MRLDCFSQGSFTWCIRFVNSSLKLVVLPPSFKMVKNIFLKFITYSNYSQLVLSLSVYLKEYHSCDREFLPFLKHTFHVDVVAGTNKHLYIHNLEIDENLPSMEEHRKTQCIDFD